MPLHEHVHALPKQVTWYADPAGRTEIEECRASGLVVRRGNNDIRAGIAAVTARLQTGRLKVCELGCPNLIAESKLYRYHPPDEMGKTTEWGEGVWSRIGTAIRLQTPSPQTPSPPPSPRN